MNSSVADHPDPAVARLARTDRLVAAAIMPTPDGRYLWQLRDEKPGIFIPGHFGLFGGGVDPGETPEQAIRRELAEELGGALDWQTRPMRLFTQTIYAFPHPKNEVHQLVFFEVPITAADVARMVLGEGADLVLMTPAEFLAADRVSPWDVAAVLMHARAAVLFG